MRLMPQADDHCSVPFHLCSFALFSAVLSFFHAKIVKLISFFANVKKGNSNNERSVILFLLKQQGAVMAAP